MALAIRRSSCNLLLFSDVPQIGLGEFGSGVWPLIMSAIWCWSVGMCMVIYLF